MRYVHFTTGGQAQLGILDGNHIESIGATSLETLLAQGIDLSIKPAVTGLRHLLSDVTLLPPLVRPPKILCVGLNYSDHTRESDYPQPDYPTLFLRVATSLIAHEQPMLRPLCSDSLDYEGELAVVIGTGGKHIALTDALGHVAGYSIFNDGSVREYQFKTPQWTVGKNFDGTGAFGPALVTPDELPAGAKGLRLETRVNGDVVQSADTSDMVFDVATLISVISEAITLEPGDVIVAGTPAGIGWARSPRLLLRDGDRVEVSIGQLGVLSNTVRDEVK